jgi:hypothetical protein
MAVKPRSKAVLFGLNYGKSKNKLRGCINDVRHMTDFLTVTCKIPCDAYADSTDAGARATTASGMTEKLSEVAKESITRDFELVVIHYSGHGFYVPDESRDEADGQDECLIPSDIETSRVVVTDDVLASILKTFNPSTKIVCVFDCCHSGTMLDLPYCWDGAGRRTGAPAATPTTEGPKILCLSGCRDDQSSLDAYNVNGGGVFSGVMTSCLLSVIKKDPRLMHDIFLLYESLKQEMKSKQFLDDQYPLLCSSYDLENDRVFLPTHNENI